MPRLAAVAAVSVALLASAAAAATTRISARLVSPSENVTARHAWAATVLVRNGRKPFTGRVSVVAAGELGRRTFAARRARPAGRHRARVVFPGGGVWTLSVRAGGRSIRVASLDVRGAGPRISRPHGFELAEEHGDLLVPDMDGTAFYEVSLRTRAKTLVGRGFSRPMFLNFGPGGFLYVADQGRIWRFEPDGSKTPVAGNGTRGLAGDGGPATPAPPGGHRDFAF